MAKAIINGKRYNTETAEEVATWSNGYSRNDFGFEEQTLYRTKKGVFFVYGEGGARSSYAQSVGSSVTGGDRVQVLTDDEAYQWLEDHDQVEAIERVFPDRFEDA